MITLAEHMRLLAPEEGRNPTPIPGIHINKSSHSKRRRPLLYEKGIIIVAQGAKRIYLNHKRYEYNPENFLVLALPLPAECEILARPEEPLLSLSIDINMADLYALITQMEVHLERLVHQGRQSGLFVSRMTPEISNTVQRLVAALHSQLESQVLGPGLVQELLFRIMCGENASALYALAMKNTNLARVDKALQEMHRNYHSALKVDELASLVHMSPSAFHRAFKEATASSPIQYLKKIRLNKARGLLESEGLRVNEAASLVGYTSPTQFSREFKRYFGDSPAKSIGSPAP